MPRSQNLKFIATVEEDAQLDHPPGAALMRRLAAELTAAGWSTGELDNWRDSGWSVVCRLKSADLEIIVSQIEDVEWLLQISPRFCPGFISSLFGGKPSASPAKVYELAVAVHSALFELAYLNRPQWRWDGFPNDKHSTPEPRVV